jgi:glutaryl-CoA dehydrogenase
MDIDVSKALETDYVHIRDEIGDHELAYLERTRTFVDDEVLPVINGYWERGEFPRDLARRMGELGLIGDGIKGYGCPDMSAAAAGLVAMELSRGDGSLTTFVGVQAGLAMRSIAEFGSEEQKEQWLGPLARVEKFGAFALTEPDHGSDSIALETTAVRDGDEYVIDGAKRWIGNGTIADVLVVWARNEEGKVNGFLVEGGTPSTSSSACSRRSSACSSTACGRPSSPSAAG